MSITSYPPSPGASPKGALPQSTQKRRDFLHQTDNDSGPMHIEHFIYQRDCYRSSSTAFPFPLPMTLEHLPPFLQEQLTPSPAIRQEILQVLRAHQIEAYNVEVYGQAKRSYPNDGDKIVPALHVDVDATQGDNLERWSAARRDISAVLQSNDLLNLEVEIQDPQRHYQPSIFPIHPAHAAVAVYEAARNELLNQVFDTIGAAWKVLSLFEVGRTTNVKKPTVLLIVEPLTIFDWKILVASLEAILDKFRGDSPRLLVEVVPGATHPIPSQSVSKEEEQNAPGLSFLDDLDSHPRHGTSIGVQGEKGGGTLGGFFKLVSPSKTHIGFITNSHVVAPSATAPFSERFQYDIMGLPYQESRAEGTRVHYFAVKDVQASIAQGHRQVQTAKNLIQEGQNRERQRRERGQANEETRSMLQNVISSQEQRIKRVQNDIAKIMEMPRLYGRTILASGRALNNKLMTLDYAFVETSTIGNRELPDPVTFRRVKVKPSDLGLNADLSLPAQSQHFSSIRPGQWYFKVGRTTDLTSGICNGVEAWVKPSNQHTLFGAKGAVKEIRRSSRVLDTDQDGRLIYDDNGKPREKAGGKAYYYSSEWVIINGSIDSESFRTQQEFCAPGDSGSLIIDEAGGVAGILWGELTGFCGPADIRRPYVGAGLVTCIEDVKDFMKIALGWPADANVEVLQFP